VKFGESEKAIILETRWMDNTHVGKMPESTPTHWFAKNHQISCKIQVLTQGVGYGSIIRIKQRDMRDVHASSTTDGKCHAPG